MLVLFPVLALLTVLGSYLTASLRSIYDTAMYYCVLKAIARVPVQVGVRLFGSFRFPERKHSRSLPVHRTTGRSTFG